jgi:hypothetical protein
MAALPLTGISTSMVAQAIGEGSNDVGTLCKSTKINKWSAWKPIASPLGTLTQVDVENAGYGLTRVNAMQFPWEISYIKPRGGAHNEPFRLGDFRNYNHSALPPVNVEIVAVNSSQFGNQTTSPFTLIDGFAYTFVFKLPIAGEINPTKIDSRAVRTKNTNPAGGYGGLTWVSGLYGTAEPYYYRQPNEVFSCPSTEQLSQILLISSTLRLQYCEYLGDADGRYRTIPTLWAENETYRSLFSIRNLSASFAYHSTQGVWYDPISKKVFVRVLTTNNENFGISTARMTFKYKVNNGTEITLVTPSFSMDANTTNNRSYEIAGGVQGQDNDYYVRGWLEVYNAYSDTWIEVDYWLLEKTIYIPINN